MSAATQTPTTEATEPMSPGDGSAALPAGDLAAAQMLAVALKLLKRLQHDPTDPDGYASNALADLWGPICPDLGPLFQGEAPPDQTARAIGHVVWGELCPPDSHAAGGYALQAFECGAVLLQAAKVGGPLAVAICELYELVAIAARLTLEPHLTGQQTAHGAPRSGDAA